MYEPIKNTIHILLEKYLQTKFDASRVAKEIDTAPNIIAALCSELDVAVERFNSYKTIGFPPYLVNAIELFQHLPTDLPKFCDLSLSETIIDDIGSRLRDDPYFVEIWQISDPTDLLCNLLLLVYRNYLLTVYANRLTHSDGSRKVQISSSIEELLFQLQIEGKKTQAAQAFLRWLKDWKEEGFSEYLYHLVLASSS